MPCKGGIIIRLQAKMTKIDPRTERFLRDLPFFEGMEEVCLHDFFSQASIHEYQKNHTLLRIGDAAEKLYIIISGWVKIYRLTSEGEESVLALFTRGDVFGEASIFNGANYPFSAEIAEDAKLMEISGSFLRTRAKASSSITQKVMESMSREMTKLQMENEHLAIMTAPQRVGCLLLQLSSDMLGKGGTFTFPYDKSLAASRLGMKAETFSRALAQLKPVGVTVRGSEIAIESYERLVGHVCGNCSSANQECRGSRGFKGCETRNCSACKH